jgi:CheY-like chemotaxis protein
MHILLAEDNPADISLFRFALKSLSLLIELSIASDGGKVLPMLRDASSSASASPIDLVLLDLNLPLKTGLEVLTELRQDPALRFLPVVVFSSTASPHEVNQCYELGAKAYMVKPMMLDEYIQKVQATVRFWQACQFRTLP